MFKIVHISKDENHISVKELETGNTRAFSKVIVDDNGLVIGDNPEFKKQIDAFAGKGFCEANGIE